MSSLDFWRQGRSTPRTLLDEVWSALDDFDRGYTVTRQRNQSAMTTACDIAETDDSFVLTFDVPGLKSEDINIEVTGRQLTISGERKREEDFHKGNTHRIERSFGSFQRSFELPDNTNTEQIEASYESGVLKVAVPKAETAKSRKIQIGATGEKSFLKRLTNKSDAKAANA